MKMSHISRMRCLPRLMKRDKRLSDANTTFEVLLDTIEHKSSTVDFLVITNIYEKRQETSVKNNFVQNEAELKLNIMYSMNNFISHHKLWPNSNRTDLTRWSPFICINVA